MSTISERESEEIEAANTSGSTPVDGSLVVDSVS